MGVLLPRRNGGPLLGCGWCAWFDLAAVAPQSPAMLCKRLTTATLVGVAMLLTSPALAGPPFDTDNPEPTETGHWEIYAPAADFEGKGDAYAGSTGVELNYGAAPNLQLPWP